MTTRSAAEILRTMLEQWESGDLDAWAAMMDDDAVFQMPFTPSGYPARLEGRAQWEPSVRKWFGELFKEFRWTALNVYPAADPAIAFAIGQSSGTTHDGRTYQNDYCWICRVRNERLVELTEYFNPLKVLQTFGQPATASREERPAAR